MKILLTGGAGFIGSHLAERMLGRGDELAVLDNFNDSYSPAIKEDNISRLRKKGGFALYRGSLLDSPLLDQIFRTHKFDCVVHLAARAGVRPSLLRPDEYCTTNVTGTAILLDKARSAETRHFIFGSSSSVYGTNDKVPFHEDDPVNLPASPYAATKRAGELLCYSAHHAYGLPVTCLRFFTVYGPRQRPDMAICKFTRLIAEGDTIPVYGRGRTERDYTYVDDIVAGITAALERPSGFSIFNLGNSRTVKLIDLVRLLEREMGKPASLEFLPDQPGDVPITYADIGRAEAELGYRPAVSIEEGVRRFLTWFRESGRLY